MRRRIVTLAIAATVVAVVLFGVPLAVLLAHTGWEDERTEVGRVAISAALSISDELKGAAAPRLPAAPAETRLAVYFPSGELRGGEGPRFADEAVAEAFDGETELDDTGSAFVAAVPIVDDGALLGVVRAEKPRYAAHLHTALLCSIILGLALVSVGVAWLLARRMARRLARPLEDLSGAAKVLGEGDFTVRAPMSGVPEIDSLGQSLGSAARRIGDTLDRERAFSAHASHQLRTPLAGLRLQLEAALESPADPRPAVRTAIEAADRLERTVDDLLVLARDTTATQVADLDALLAELESTWGEPLAARGRAIRISADEAPRPQASAAAVRQVLNVLVDNAYTHGRGTVRVTARDAGGVLAVDVSDEGEGVAPGQQLFTRKSGGHGIGLPLARSLAEADGGRLVHVSGSTFTLLLPVGVRV
ncbi:sensor histidine kinase [Amycolatopsis sacchari]|uniref:Signal transduction histidine-protein kinase/phosphatase MprB n=1 Tax=Amycolatopsis sacchari TaxID=115433 RepID=A0A1I3QDA1_9PSEU|nr:HAMP domain-containing sensor histidine kinase [Amycolatopsis sacchari]SFJ31331.1 Signal transduction histidine kinase [Amycolatopsis sacchari]